MTTYTCPDGHASSTGDYCDVCGMPIPAGGTAGAPSAAPVGAVPVPGAAPGGSSLDLDAPVPPPLPAGSGGIPTVPSPSMDLTCPHCGASNLPDALYCEDCGYDFTTGQLPRPLGPPSGVPAAPPAADTGALPLPGSTGASTGAPMDGSTGGSSADPSAAGADAGAPSAGADGSVSVVATAAPAPDGGPGLAAPSGGAASSGGTGPILAPPVTPTSAPGHVEWVAEVWIDPDWYAAQDVADPCPSPGMPWVIPILERTVLVGRVSASRNIHPQIDISTDNGVSRRHAQLSSDGQRWWVEDLQSANGTFVGTAGAPLPETPITPGQRVELAEDARVYLGAWSRLVVRRATPEESTLGT